MQKENIGFKPHEFANSISKEQERFKILHNLYNKIGAQEKQNQEFHTLL